MVWKLDDSRPIWLQLKEGITEKIISGEYPSGEKLISVRELAAEAGVNPNTMQRALTRLDEEGLTETSRTSGRFVTSDSEVVNKVRLELAEDKTEKFLKSMEKIGFNRDEIISIIKGERVK